MDTEDFVASRLVRNDTCKRKPFEQVIQLLEHTVGIVNVLTKSVRTFLTKTEISIDVPVFMIASEQEDLLRVLQFESQEQNNNFQALIASIHIISQKEVVISCDVSRFARCFPEIEETHKVHIVAMDVAENFDGWF